MKATLIVLLIAVATSTSSRRAAIEKHKKTYAASVDRNATYAVQLDIDAIHRKQKQDILDEVQQARNVAQSMDGLLAQHKKIAQEIAKQREAIRTMTDLRAKVAALELETVRETKRLRETILKNEHDLKKQSLMLDAYKNDVARRLNYREKKEQLRLERLKEVRGLVRNQIENQEKAILRQKDRYLAEMKSNQEAKQRFHLKRMQSLTESAEMEKELRKRLLLEKEKLRLGDVQSENAERVTLEQTRQKLREVEKRRREEDHRILAEMLAKNHGDLSAEAQGLWKFRTKEMEARLAGAADREKKRLWHQSKRDKKMLKKRVALSKKDMHKARIALRRYMKNLRKLERATAGAQRRNADDIIALDAEQTQRKMLEAKLEAEREMLRENQATQRKLQQLQDTVVAQVKKLRKQAKHFRLGAREQKRLAALTKQQVEVAQKLRRQIEDNRVRQQLVLRHIYRLKAFSDKEATAQRRRINALNETTVKVDQVGLQKRRSAQALRKLRRKLDKDFRKTKRAIFAKRCRRFRRKAEMANEATRIKKAYMECRRKHVELSKRMLEMAKPTCYDTDLKRMVNKKRAQHNVCGKRVNRKGKTVKYDCRPLNLDNL